MLSVTRRQALAWRLRRQHLVAGASDATEVVRTLGAVSVFGSDPDLAVRRRLAEPGAAKPFIPIHRGFVRAGGPAGWVLTGKETGPNPGPDPEFRLSASWKTSVGRVDVLKNTKPINPAPVGDLPPFPAGVLALGIEIVHDEDDAAAPVFAWPARQHGRHVDHVLHAVDHDRMLRIFRQGHQTLHAEQLRALR